MSLPIRILSSVLSKFSPQRAPSDPRQANAVDVSPPAPTKDAMVLLNPPVSAKNAEVPNTLTSSSPDFAPSSFFGPKAERKRRELLDRLKEDLTCGICSNVMVLSHGI